MEDVGSGTPVCLVVPCFNEERRLRSAELRELADDPRVSLILVDDGSTDGTARAIESLARVVPLISVLKLEGNCGKGEAVRRGLLAASQRGHRWVGYIDADLATPVSEVVRLIGVAEDRPDVDVIIGARVALLGRRISRSAFRHYTGRIFATLATLTLGRAVYDTQNGAKLLRSSTALEAAIAEPFRSRWAFDVELLGRLELAGVSAGAYWEEPLLEWRDVPGSKRTLWSSVIATAELWPIAAELRRRRRQPTR